MPVVRAPGCFSRVIGGKVSHCSGAPLDLAVEVRWLQRDARHECASAPVPLGDVAVVRAARDFDLVLSSVRCQCYGPRAFSDFGIALDQKRVLVVKSMQHFVAAFGPLAAEIVYVDSPGAASLSFQGLSFKHVDKSLWPFGLGKAPPHAMSYRDQKPLPD